MTLMLALSLVLSLAAPQSPALSAASITLTPKKIAEFDLSQLKGEIRILTFSPDGADLYLETAELKSDALPKETYHYILKAATGELKKVDAEPAWSASYRESMKFKSAPGDDAFLIALETEQRKATATSTPMGGDYARGGTGADTGGVAGGVSADTVAAAANQSQTGTAHVMRLKGQIVGEWLNRPIVPGQSYGWGPQGSNVIAYAEPNNRQLMIMDKSGAKQKISDTKGVYSPAFSADGKRLAWLELRGKKVTFLVADVAQK
jgi:hypothetical protein